MNYIKKMNSRLKYILPSIVLALCSLGTIRADVLYIDPLFEYPVAPDEIISLADKSNWLMQHFWDKMDFKNKNAVNQSALNDAFKVYTLPMQWADKDEVDKATDKMIALLAKNPTLQLQFMKAAEECLYGPRAKVWIDEVYIKYIESFLKNKKVPDARKIRYRRQLQQLKNSLINSAPASFDFVTPTGNPGTYRPIGVFTIIEFGDPNCDDCRHSKLKMETDMRFTSLVDKGLVNVMFIVPDPIDGWQTQLGDYPSNWIVGASESVSDILDLRTTPSFYVIDTDGKILAKNVTVDDAKALAFKQENSAQ